MEQSGLTTHIPHKTEKELYWEGRAAGRRGLRKPVVIGRRWTVSEWQAYCARTSKAERKLGVA